MKQKATTKNRCLRPSARGGVFLALLVMISICMMALVYAAPASPQITYVSNSSLQSAITNRSQDIKGTITTLNLNLQQQDYKWKAYVGNVTGKLALDDANAKSIYDWTLSTISGEVYASRSSNINWASMACANAAAINNEQTALGMTGAMADSINNTFSYQAHRSFLVGVTNITASSCSSTATYINDAAQTVDANALFQEILLRDTGSGALIYSTLLEANQQGYDGTNTYDFQMIVAENESASSPTTYYFYAELG